MSYQIFVPLIPFALGIILKTLLDFNLALFVVKYFHKIPMRPIFRMKVYDISGKWKQMWDYDNPKKYASEEARKSSVTIKQFGKYCYGEFRASNDEEYYMFGEVIGRNIIGKWADRTNELGYFGSFELRIINNVKMEGIWLGHSNETPEKINAYKWEWAR